MRQIPQLLLDLFKSYLVIVQLWSSLQILGGNTALLWPLRSHDELRVLLGSSLVQNFSWRWNKEQTAIFLLVETQEASEVDWREETLYKRTLIQILAFFWFAAGSRGPLCIHLHVFFLPHASAIRACDCFLNHLTGVDVRLTLSLWCFCILYFTCG